MTYLVSKKQRSDIKDGFYVLYYECYGFTLVIFKTYDLIHYMVNLLLG